MKNIEILRKQEQLLREVDFLANKFTQNERRNNKNIISKKSRIHE